MAHMSLLRPADGCVRATRGSTRHVEWRCLSEV